jgi:hypothetical protein
MPSKSLPPHAGAHSLQQQQQCISACACQGHGLAGDLTAHLLWWSTIAAAAAMAAAACRWPHSRTTEAVASHPPTAKLPLRAASAAGSNSSQHARDCCGSAQACNGKRLCGVDTSNAEGSCMHCCPSSRACANSQSLALTTTAAAGTVAQHVHRGCCWLPLHQELDTSHHLAPRWFERARAQHCPLLLLHACALVLSDHDCCLEPQCLCECCSCCGVLRSQTM